MTLPTVPSAPDRGDLAREHRQCRHVAQVRGVDLDRAKLELAATRSRASAFASQLDAALLRVAVLEDVVAGLQAELIRLAALRRTEDETRRETAAVLRAEIAALLLHRDEALRLRESTSWRVTRPLRALKRLQETLRAMIRRVINGSGD
jgi:hypothetical protein